MMKTIILSLALLAGVEGAHLRRNLSAMELASEALPAQIALPSQIAPASASDPPPAVSLAPEALPTQTAPEAAPVAAAAAPVAAPVAVAAEAAAAAPATLTENQVWAQGVAKKTTDEALLTLFDVAAQLKTVYHSFDTDGDGSVGATEVAALAHPVASLRRLQMELATEDLPAQVAAGVEPSPAMLAADSAPTAVTAAPAAVTAAPAAVTAAPAAVTAAPAAVTAAPAAVTAAPAAVAAAPAASVLSALEHVAPTNTEAKLAHLFSLVEKLVLVHGIFDADSDGVVSAGDLIKIAKGPAA